MSSNKVSKWRKSLIIYLPNLASGGAERLHLNLAPLFVAAGYDVSFLLHKAEGALVPLVPKGIHILSLDCGRTLKGLLPMVKFLRRERPDIVVSNLGHNNIVALWARFLARVPTKIIVSHHSSLSAEVAAADNWQFRVLPAACRLFLKWADGIVCVSKGVAEDLARITRLPLPRFTVIYNPVILDDFDRRMAEEPIHPWLADSEPPVFLGVGRFVTQKDFATLLAAFAITAQQREARLILLGEGPLKESLMAQAELLGIGDRVSFPGFVANPLPLMRKAAVLVMSSLYEGFGNVLVEALACGTPVVTTNCPSGPAEVVEDGHYGRLVPVGDPQAMAAAMIATLDDAPDPAFLAARGREFTVERAANLYLRLFDQIA